MARGTIDPRVIKKELTDNYVSIFDEKKAGKNLQELTKNPGFPTQDFILIEVGDNDIAVDKLPNGEERRSLDSVVFKIIALGPDVKSPALKPGASIQVSPQARMVTLQWGEKQNCLVREYEIIYVFSLDPKEEYKKQIELIKSDSKQNSVPLSAGGDA